MASYHNVAGHKLSIDVITVDCRDIARRGMPGRGEVR